MRLNREFLIELLKFVPFCSVLDVVVAQLSLVLFVHRELASVPIQNFFDARRARSEVVIISSDKLLCSTSLVLFGKVHLFVSDEKVLLRFFFDLRHILRKFLY